MTLWISAWENACLLWGLWHFHYKIPLKLPLAEGIFICFYPNKWSHSALRGLLDLWDPWFTMFSLKCPNYSMSFKVCWFPQMFLVKNRSSEHSKPVHLAWKCQTGFKTSRRQTVLRVTVKEVKSIVCVCVCVICSLLRIIRSRHFKHILKSPRTTKKLIDWTSKYPWLCGYILLI